MPVDLCDAVVEVVQCLRLLDSLLATLCSISCPLQQRPAHALVLTELLEDVHLRLVDISDSVAQRNFGIAFVGWLVIACSDHLLQNSDDVLGRLADPSFGRLQGLATLATAVLLLDLRPRCHPSLAESQLKDNPRLLLE